MIGIYLCDDEDSVRHQIQTALEWKIIVANYDMEVVCSAAKAQELLDAVEDSKQGVYFLDVDLKDEEWDGFRLGRELRRRDPRGTLVYITSYEDLAWHTFQYHLEAFDYIVKGPEPVGAWMRYTGVCWRSVRPRQRRSPCGREIWCAMSRCATYSFLKPPLPHTMSFSIRPAAG